MQSLSEALKARNGDSTVILRFSARPYGRTLWIPCARLIACDRKT
jgi:hypothetical protein